MHQHHGQNYPANAMCTTVRYTYKKNSEKYQNCTIIIYLIREFYGHSEPSVKRLCKVKEKGMVTFFFIVQHTKRKTTENLWI
jgi:hypothetical protein